MAQEIIKIADNNVEVREYVIDKETDTKYILKTESYGIAKLTPELAKAITDVTNWSNKDYVVAYGQNMLEEAQKRQTKLLAVESALAGAISDI